MAISFGLRKSFYPSDFCVSPNVYKESDYCFHPWPNIAIIKTCIEELLHFQKNNLWQKVAACLSVTFNFHY